MGEPERLFFVDENPKFREVFVERMTSLGQSIEAAVGTAEEAKIVIYDESRHFGVAIIGDIAAHEENMIEYYLWLKRVEIPIFHLNHELRTVGRKRFHRYFSKKHSAGVILWDIIQL